MGEKSFRKVIAPDGAEIKFGMSTITRGGNFFGRLGKKGPRGSQ